MKYFKVNKRGMIIAISYICAAMAVLAAFVFVEYKKAEDNRRIIYSGYMRSFSELSSDVSEIDTSLQKVLYSESPALLTSLCANIYGKANSAQTAMAELPLSDYMLENASAFLTRTGDYLYYISKKVSEGSGLSEEEYSNLQKLSDSTTILSQNLMDMQTGINNGTVSISEMGKADSGTSDAFEFVGERFQMVENEFPEIPTLIYDGPFSQHIKNNDPELIRGKAQVSEDEARAKAADFSGVAESELGLSYESDGDVPCYCFQNSDGSCYINVTKAGGEIYTLINCRNITDPSLSNEAAVKQAADFLAAKGYGELKDSYWTKYDNALLVNFAPVENGCICYPDLIKVSIALDNGEIVGFDDAGYIASHKEREIPSAAVSETDAESKVSSALTILSHDMCIIPDEGKNEIFCHEFKCQSENGNHYIVYVNALTGEDAKILCLIEDENGTLTM